MTDRLPTHTAQGYEIHWSWPEPVDISGWPEDIPIDETACATCAAPHGHKHDLVRHVAGGTLNTRGIVIRDSRVPPFPADYEPEP